MSALVFWYNPSANTATTNTFITKLTNKATQASMKKYKFASRTFSGLVLSISRDLTSAECKYKLCGIITAPEINKSATRRQRIINLEPIIPTACKRALESQFLHQGMNIPSSTPKPSGFDVIYSYPKVTPMTVIKSPKKDSSFLKPYLSNIKKVNVSIMVIRTPPHIGTLQNIVIGEMLTLNINMFYLVFDKR